MNTKRASQVMEHFGKLIPLTNELPRGFGFHSLVNLIIPITPGSTIILGSVRDGNLDIFSSAPIGERFGLGSYRVGVFMVPEASPEVGRVITPFSKS